MEPLDDQPVEVSDRRWTFDPPQTTRSYRDIYGNPCRRLVMPAGRSVMGYEATAVVPDAVEAVDEDAPEVPADDLPDDVLIYTLPSRYCLPDVLGDEAWITLRHDWRGDTGGSRRSATTCTAT